MTRIFTISANDDTMNTRAAVLTRVTPISVTQSPVEIEVFVQALLGTTCHLAKTSAELYAKVRTVVEKHNTSRRQRWNFFGRQPQKLIFALFFKNKPLRDLPISLSDYGIYNKDVVHVEFYFSQGGFMSNGANDVMFDFIKRGIAPTMTPEVFEIMNDYLENLIIFVKLAKKADNFDDAYNMLVIMTKLFTKRPFSDSLNKAISKISNVTETGITFLMERFFGKSSNVQAGWDIPEMDFRAQMKIMRGALDSVNEFEDHPVVKKFVSLCSYMLTFGILEKMGINFELCKYNEFEANAIRAKYSSSKGFLLCVADVTLFIVERAFLVYKTGDVRSIMHSGSQYEQWLDRAILLKRQALLTSNPEAHGFTYFEFLSNLDDAIDNGEGIVKYNSRANQFEFRQLRTLLNDLKLIKNAEITKRASQQERRAPFGMLVHGGSSVAKSTFTKMMFYYYGKLFNLPTDSEYRYVRNSVDEYWSGFTTSKWCVQLDDIAFLRADKAPQGDPSVLEMLQVVNNVPFVPTQAALEDKGRTPMKARFVIATSNSEDLNAQEYFHCPLAVQRRLPFVVTITPKKEYARADGLFIDPSKLPPIDDTAFPDYWDIHLRKIKPVVQHGKQYAELVDAVPGKPVISDIHEFLQIFASTVHEHELVQDKAMTCDLDMANIQLCEGCFLPSAKCVCAKVQATDVLVPRVPIDDVDFSAYEAVWKIHKREARSFWRFCTDKFWSCIFFFIFNVVLFRFGFFQLSRNRFFRSFVWNRVFDGQDERQVLQVVGMYNERMTTSTKLKIAASALTALSAGFLAYKLYVKCTEKSETVVQGVSASTGVEIKPVVEETANVWFKDTYTCTKFDVQPATASMAGISDEEIRRIFSANCVHIRPRAPGAGRSRPIRAFCLRGHYYVTNNHAFLEEDVYEVEVKLGPDTVGVNENFKVNIRQSDLVRLPEHDLCFFELACCPPKKDITKFLAESTLQGQHAGVYIARDIFGDVGINVLHDLQQKVIPVPELDCSPLFWYGQACDVTKAGDCGSMLVLKTPRGPVLAGLHLLGSSTKHVGATVLTVQIVNDALVKLGKISLTSSKIGSGVPSLSAQGYPRALTELSRKSVVRFSEEGVANVYGSFAGFHVKPKSKVCRTPLCDEIVEHFDIEVKHGQPQMSGWKPWRNSFVEMIKPNVTYDKVVLNECVESFTSDIIAGLDDSGVEWKNDLCILTNSATVNGVAGMKYLDKINTNTSMGNPWKCTKKKFLIPAPTEDLPNGVDFPEDIWERVDACIEAYKRGERYMPVFCGHLKDEATAQAKIDAAKTRVFTGAPIDWSLVVRKYLLTTVRLIQKNKFVFEAGPGTVCQSLEWEQFHEYLTFFGENQIVAGDYGKFDKRMLADFILAAFKIIKNVLRESGWTEEDLVIVDGIAEDTAFPLVDFNGDLIEFFGTNPSGHPLTVIVNSLVNCLYMRYCFCRMNPAKTGCVDFKKHVKLMTYGDDNIMGVDPSIGDWFNHTTIQAELVEIGVEYTMADKTSASVPFVNLSDVSFLKRVWRWDEDVEAFLCPLEEASIHKSLTVWVPSSSISAEAQMIAVIQSAMNEYFFYGRARFEKERAFFMSLCSSEPFCLYVNEATFPTWEQLYNRFWFSSTHLVVRRHGVVVKHPALFDIPERDVEPVQLVLQN